MQNIKSALKFIKYGILGIVGAIDLFKRTGYISKLQSSMGHSSIKFSLTYLRDLEVTELTEEDMLVID